MLSVLGVTTMCGKCGLKVADVALDWLCLSLGHFGWLMVGEWLAPNPYRKENQGAADKFR